MPAAEILKEAVDLLCANEWGKMDTHCLVRAVKFHSDGTRYFIKETGVQCEATGENDITKGYNSQGEYPNCPDCEGELNWISEVPGWRICKECQAEFVDCAYVPFAA